jgi:hypothetical protein
MESGFRRNDGRSAPSGPIPSRGADRFSSVVNVPFLFESCYKGGMPIPPVIAFTPVPLRPRADGWSPDLQLRFIVGLSHGLTPGDAARSVGKNRQTAYALRKRPGAESFAAAWGAAVDCTRRRRTPPAAVRPGPASRKEAEALARRGVEAVERAAQVSEAARRRAFSDMLDSFYGSKSDNGDGGETRGRLAAKRSNSRTS